MQKSLLEYLENTAARLADKLAYRDENQALSFAQVLQEAKKIGSALCGHTAANQPILVFSGKHVYTPVLYLAVLYAGCFYVPIDPSLPRHRLEVILGIADAKLAVTDHENAGLLEKLNYQGKVLLLDALRKETPADDVLAKRRAGALDIDPAYVIFTSGSSGVPKGVVASHRNVIDYIDNLSAAVGIDETDILGNQAPLDYDAANRDIYLPLCTGASTVLIPKSLFSTPEKLFQYLNEHGVTTLSWVAAAVALCAEMNAFKTISLTSVRKVLFTGSALLGKHLRLWQQNLPGAVFVNHYGPTEATSTSTYHVVDHLVEEGEQLPIGVPFNNVRIVLLGENDMPVPPGGRGEICIAGSCLTLGYYRAPDKTRAAFVPNPLQEIYPEIIYRTGDTGSLRPDGVLLFYGREDNQIKHMGHRVELSEIEAEVNRLPNVSASVCLYQPEKEFIWLFCEGLVDKKELAVHLRGRLPGYMVPRKFVIFDSMPRAFNGKVDMEALRRMMREEI